MEQVFPGQKFHFILYFFILFSFLFSIRIFVHFVASFSQFLKFKHSYKYWIRCFLVCSSSSRTFITILLTMVTGEKGKKWRRRQPDWKKKKMIFYAYFSFFFFSSTYIHCRADNAQSLMPYALCHLLIEHEIYRILHNNFLFVDLVHAARICIQIVFRRGFFVLYFNI